MGSASLSRAFVRFAFAASAALGLLPGANAQATLGLAVGQSHACAITSAGAVMCWGWNDLGQIGDGTVISRSTPVAVVGMSSGITAIAAGYGHTCALNSSGGVSCWGNNYYGQLGDGTNTQRNSPVPVTGMSSGVVAISAGGQHTCALTNTGAVECWGSNDYGQIGDNTGLDQWTPVSVTGLSSSATIVRAGEHDSCALVAAGALQCWGDDYYGELGDGNSGVYVYAPINTLLTSGVAGFDLGYLHSCALTTSGGVKCWGRNPWGQLGNGTNNDSLVPVDVLGLTSGVASVGTGFSGSCAVTTGGATLCWGGNAGNSTSPVAINGLSSGVLDIGVGGSVVCARLATGIKCWGSNSYGEVGDGTTTNRNDPVDVIGLGGGGGTSQTITFGALSGQTFGAAPFTVSATASSGLTVAFTSTTAPVCTVAGSTVTLVGAGTCTIAANQAGNGTYLAAPQVTQSFTVAKAAQTITFGTLSGKTFGAAPFAVSATASSGLAVAFTSSTTPVCTVSGTTVTIVAAGTCTIAANQAGNGNYNAASQVSQSFTVAKATQTITFGALPGHNVGDAPFALTATASSGLAVTYTSSTTPVCTVSGSTVTIVATGTCTIAANQAGNANYNAATQVTQSFTVSPAKTAQTITFGALSGQTFGAAPFTVSATASSGLAVTFTSTTTPVCTVSGTTVTIVAAGTCTIAANQAGNATYLAAPQVTQSFTVAKAAQTITFGALPGHNVGDAPFALTATASSGLTVAFTSSTTPVCTVSGSTVTIVATGTCTIAANQAGNGNYNAATQVTQSFTVSPAKTAQTITFGALSGQTFGAAPFTVSATASSGLAVTFTSTTTPVCTVSGTTVTIVAAGTCTIAANQAGNATYAAAPQVTQSFTVAKAAQTITFGALPGHALGDAPFALTATASSGLAVTYTSSTTPVCTVSGSTVTIVATGTCTIAANQAGNGNYNAATQVTQSFSVKTAQTITFGALAGKSFGAAPFTVAATASSGLAVTFTSTTTAVCTVSGSTVTLVTVGTCTIAANQAGNATYAAAPQVTQSFAVAKGAQTITFGALPGHNVGDAPFALTATASSGLAVTYTSSTTPVCTVSGSTVTIVATGTCTIAANQAGNANYNAATQVTQSFTVSPAKTAQTITFGALSGQTFGAAPFTVSATASSGLAVTFTSTTTPVCTVSGTTVTIVAAGTCTIAANQAGNATYLAAPQVTQSFTVAKAAQTITFGALPGHNVGDAPFALTATASSGLTVAFTSSTTPVCTVSGSTVTIVATGTCTIAANQAGNGNYNAATQVTQSFTVSPAKTAQTITFGALSGQTFGAAPFTVSATASSGLAVTFTSTTTPVCTVSGTTVTIVAAGTCTIAANQAGNATYAAAPQVTQSFTVAKAAQTITFGALPGHALGDAPFALTATASSGLAVTYTSSTTPVCTVSGSTVTIVATGTCTIAANQAGNGNYNAATQVTQSFSVKTAQTITFGALAGKSFGAAPFTVAATASSGLAVTFTSTTTAVCTVSGSTVTLVTVGTCTIAANQAGNATYAAAPQVTQSFAVAKGAQTITFGALPGHNVGDAPFALTATASSGLAVTYTSSTTPVCTVSGSTVTIVATGTCTIAANQAGNANYNAATQVTQSFTVSPAKTAQTITFGALSGQTFGAAPFTVSATASSGLAVTFTSTTTPVCTVSGTTVTIVAAGTCTIAANQAGNATYLAAPQVTQSFTVAKAAQTITFGALPGHNVGDAPFALTATASSGLTVAFTSSTTPVCTVSGSTVTIVATGTCTIAANQAGNGNYNAATQVTQSFTVSPAKTAQTITFGALSAKSFGDVFAVSATASSGLAVVFTSTTPGVCTVNVATVAIVAVGTCTVAANQPGNGSYLAAPQVTQSLTAGQLSQSIAFSAAPTAAAVGAPQTISATATSGLPVTYTSNTTSVCTVSGATVAPIAAGTCTIAANQAGNTSYSAAPAVTQSFAIAKGAQTITTFAPPAFVQYSGSLNNVQLTATAGASGSPVTYTVTGSTPLGTVCEYVLIGGLPYARIYTGGVCTVTAGEAGSANYNAAPTLTATIVVGPASQTVTFPALASQVFGVAPIPLTTASAPGGAIDYSSSTPSVCTVTPRTPSTSATVTPINTGTCTVVASQAGSVSYSAAQATQSFTVTPGTLTPQAITGTGPSGPVTYSQGATFAFTATGGGSGNPVVVVSTTSDVCTISGGTATLLGTGTCTLTATQAGNATYAAAVPVTASVIVTAGATHPPVLSTPILPPAVVAQPYLASLALGTSSPVSDAFVDGLPTGLSATFDGNGNVTVSGTPTQGGYFPLPVSATNSSGQATTNGSMQVQNFATNVASVSAGDTHTCAVLNGGVRCWGGNGTGQLGNNTIVQSQTPVIAVPDNSNATVVSAGVAHTCAVVNAGVQCWGSNSSGQLGNGGTTQSNVPVISIAAGSSVSAVSAGNAHTCAIVLGAVQCWGSNASGQLGDGTTTTRLSPVSVTGATSGATAVAAGYDHTCAIVNGGVMCWGGNYDGQLGNNSTTRSLVPVVTIAAGSGVLAIASGASHSCAITAAYVVECWGSNLDGRLATNASNTTVPNTTVAGGVMTAVSAGRAHTCAVIDGGVQCWGQNSYGQLGNGNKQTVKYIETEQALPAGSNATLIAAGGDHSCAVVNGAVECWGGSTSGQLGAPTTTLDLTPSVVIKPGSNATAVSADGGQVCAVVDGGLSCWGAGSTFSSGCGAWVDTTTPNPLIAAKNGISDVGVGAYGACYVKLGGTACLTPTALGGQSTSNPIGVGSFATAVQESPLHACSVVNGGVQCWGTNIYGELGNGTTTYSSSPVVAIPAGSGATSVSTGASHTCAVVQGGVKCWGLNGSGQLGIGTTVDSHVPAVVVAAGGGATSVGAGTAHSCAVVAGGVKCWGANAQGQLGNNSTTQSLVPVVAIPAASLATAVSAGDQHSCAIVDGGVKCWGANGSGQLGNGTTTASLVPATAIAAGSSVTDISATTLNTCVVENGGVLCWGDNTHGQTGDSSTFSNQKVFSDLATSGGASAPTISAPSAGPGSITFQIAAPASNGGSPITAYTATCAAAGHLTITTTVDASVTSITVAGLDPGAFYSCSAAADNSNGVGASSAPVNATPGATPTTALIMSPVNFAAYVAPANVTITASASATGGTSISKVDFYQGSTLIGTSTTAPYSVTWNAVAVGTYQITARATDSSSGIGTSPAVSVTLTLAGETITYLHNDFAGSPLAATDASGTVIWKEAYEPFGNQIRKEAASAGNRQFFTGKPFDPDTGLSYFGARYYDPIVGRFMGVDPAGFKESNIHSFSRYEYGNNNPYGFVDPDGNFALSALLIEIAAQTGAGYLLGVAADSIGQYAAWGSVDLSMAATSSAAIAGGESGLLSGTVSGAFKAYAAGKTGIVYLRTNPTTGEQYVGQTKSAERFIARQSEHDSAQGVRHDYEVLGNAKPGQELNRLEESKIRELGGIKKEGGPLSNKRHQMSEKNYRAAGGKVDLPN